MLNPGGNHQACVLPNYFDSFNHRFSVSFSFEKDRLQVVRVPSGKPSFQLTPKALTANKNLFGCVQGDFKSEGTEKLPIDNRLRRNEILHYIFFMHGVKCIFSKYFFAVQILFTHPDEADILIFQVSFRSNKSSSGVHTSDTRPAQRSTYGHGSHCIHTVTSHRSLQSCKITAGRRRSRGLQLGLAAAPEFSHPMQLCTVCCSAQAQVLDPWMVQARGADRCMVSAEFIAQ